MEATKDIKDVDTVSKIIGIIGDTMPDDTAENKAESKLGFKVDPEVMGMIKAIGPELQEILKEPEEEGRRAGSLRSAKFGKALELWYNWLMDNNFFSKWNTGEVHSMTASSMADADVKRDPNTKREVLKPGALQKLMQAAAVFFKIAPISYNNRQKFFNTLRNIARPLKAGEKQEIDAYEEVLKWLKNIILKNKGLSSAKKSTFSYEKHGVEPEKEYTFSRKGEVKGSDYVAPKRKRYKSGGKRSFKFPSEAEAERYYKQFGGKPPEGPKGVYWRVNMPGGGVETFTDEDEAWDYANQVGVEPTKVGEPYWVVRESIMDTIPSSGLKIYDTQEEAVASLIESNISKKKSKLIEKAHSKKVWVGLVEGYQEIPDEDNPALEKPKSGYGDLDSDLPPDTEGVNIESAQINSIAESIETPIEFKQKKTITEEAKIDSPDGSGVQKKEITKDDLPQEPTDTKGTSPGIGGGVEKNQGGSTSGLKSGESGDATMDSPGGDTAQDPSVKQVDGTSGEGTMHEKTDVCPKCECDPCECPGKQELDEAGEYCEDDEEIDECGIMGGSVEE